MLVLVQASTAACGRPVPWRTPRPVTESLSRSSQADLHRTRLQRAVCGAVQPVRGALPKSLPGELPGFHCQGSCLASVRAAGVLR